MRMYVLVHDYEDLIAQIWVLIKDQWFWSSFAFMISLYNIYILIPYIYIYKLIVYSRCSPNNRWNGRSVVVEFLCAHHEWTNGRLVHLVYPNSWPVHAKSKFVSFINVILLLQNYSLNRVDFTTKNLIIFISH